jgi:hypothetical protein
MNANNSIINNEYNSSLTLIAVDEAAHEKRNKDTDNFLSR